MEITKKIKQKFETSMARNDDLKIEGWAFLFQQGNAIKIAIDQNDMGGPYGSPIANDICVGSTYLRWADGRVSKAKIDTPALEDLETALHMWRATSYTDEYAPEIFEPQPVPEMNLVNPDIAAIVSSNSTPLFDFLNFFDTELNKKELVKIINAKVGADMSHVTVMNSKGLAVKWDETNLVISSNVNSKFGASFHERDMPSEEDLQKMLYEIDRYLVHSTSKVKVQSGNMPIILIPRTFEGFLGHYVAGYLLDGEEVANNTAIYTADDFRNQKQVFHKRINFLIDGLDEIVSGNAPCTGMGVPAAKQYLIAKGKLVTPDLDLKYAGKIKMAPSGPGAAKLEIDGLKPYEDLVSSVKNGLIVYNVIGIHTQDVKQGKYSIPVEEGLVVEDGKIIGSIDGNVIINGNLFEALKEEKTGFAEYSNRKGKPKIAMLTKASVTKA